MAASNQKELRGFPEFNARGFWFSSEVAGLRRDLSNILRQMEKINDTLGDLKVEVAGKLDKDDFHVKLEQLQNADHKISNNNSRWMEVLKIIVSSLAAALSALTGVKLLN